MNYELAKKLKDGGFKFRECDVYYDECDQEVLEFDGSSTPFHFPSLSELIEACGDNFTLMGPGNSVESVAESDFGLVKKSDIVLRDWNAWNIEKQIQTIGSTPEEAVANLWLALNAKIEE